MCLVSCSTDPHQRARGAHDWNTLDKSVADSENLRLQLSGRSTITSEFGLLCNCRNHSASCQP